MIMIITSTIITNTNTNSYGGGMVEAGRSD